MKKRISLAEQNPVLAAEWHPYKNEGLKPEDVFPYKNGKVWWLCKLGHGYEASPSNRQKGTGCPYCASQKVLKGFNDLASQYPEIAAEWHPDKNGSITPDSVTPHSAKKYWWKCLKGHEWFVSPSTRIKKGGSEFTSCPYCSNRKVMPGFNDLQTKYPDIAKEWDEEANDKTASEVLYGAVAMAHWKCSFGHRWKASVVSRTHMHSGCPECDKERHTSFPEQAIYYYIKMAFPDSINGSTKEIGKELDIFIPSIRTAIEYDGVHWHNNSKTDAKKNAKCKENDVRLIRIREQGLPMYDDCICIQEDTLVGNIRALFSFLGNDDCDIDLERDEKQILSSYMSIVRSNSIAFQFPELLKEWDYERNTGINPEMVQVGTHREYYWKCSECGKVWQARVYVRTTLGCGCPNCGTKKQTITMRKRLVERTSSLYEEHPELCKEWDYEKNTISPKEITSGSNIGVWWICPKGHSYKTSVVNRTNRKKEDGSFSGCRICGTTQGAKLRSVNDAKQKGSLHQLFPELAAEYDNERNELTSDEVSPGSSRKVWWICPKGHSYQTSIVNRTNRRKEDGSFPGCRICGAAHGAKMRSINEAKETGSLRQLFPELAAEYNNKRNELTSDEVTPGSSRKAWWICSEGHEWQAIIVNRTRRNDMCPACRKISGKRGRKKSI